MNEINKDTIVFSGNKKFFPDYIGDGVYICWDGVHIVLETQRDSGVETIALDPGTLGAFDRYRDYLAAKQREHAAKG